MMSQNKYWIMTFIVRSLNTTAACCNNHYDVLGLTPNATQRDIKSAYYKLSMQHHPDKTSDETSAKKFRAISEAYEVLGNVPLKKMYDRGLLGGRATSVRDPDTPEPSAEKDDPSVKFYKDHNYRQVIPTMDGRRPIYDFDAWAKGHYSDAFLKARKARSAEKVRVDKSTNSEAAVSQTLHVYFIIISLGLCGVMLFSSKPNYDVDNTERRQLEEKKVW